MLKEMIEKGDYKKADHYLRGLSLKPGDELMEKLTERHGEMTPLHLAVKHGSIDIVKVLLSFDASIDAKIGKDNVVDYAKKLSQETPLDEQRKLTYALIKSRGLWQSAAAREQGISFSRSMKAIEDAMENIRGAEGKTGVLFLGITGEGKSTFINYLCGMDYKRERVQGKRRVVATTPGKEVARVGVATTSETYLPQVLEVAGRSHVLVDLPGFEDTRGTAEEVCAAAGICMLTKQLSSIQAILLVSSWNSLEDARMVSYRKSAHNVGAMIGLNPAAAENVVLVVTKPEEDLTEEDVRARLQELATGEGWGSSATMKDANREDLSDDMWRKQCLRKATEAILSRKGSIVLADVTKSQARNSLQVALDNLEKKAKKPDLFDFKSYSRFMTQFKLVMESMIVNYNDLSRRKISREEKLKIVSNSKTEVENEIKTLDGSIEKFNKQKTQPFTAESFDKAINEEKEKLSELRKRHSASKESARSAELDLAVKTAKLSSVDKDGEKLIDTVHRGWVCEKTEDRVETVVEEVGCPIFVPGRGAMQEVRITKKNIPGTEKTVAEQVNYPSSVPIQRFVDRSQGGSFSASGFMPGTTKLTGTFNSASGASGGVSLSIELYGNIKDFPGTKEKIGQLELDAKNAKESLETSKKDFVPEDAIEACSENLRKMELEKISAVGSHDRTQTICDMQINLLGPQVIKAKERLAELNQQLADEKIELTDLTVQLQVNEELFIKILKIIDVMGFKSDLISNFKQLFRQGQVNNEKAISGKSPSDSQSAISSSSFFQPALKVKTQKQTDSNSHYNASMPSDDVARNRGMK
jgi:GTP-binding protein EngB required for normal cell division